MYFCYSGNRVQVSQLGSKEVRKGEQQQNCTLVASHRTPSTGALERFCEFLPYMPRYYRAQNHT